ncbi:MAG: amidohydrolase [Candidatus Wallbacteria bacterium]|nr:amidohydrolase [Candidatus Wallbacteria bacterium]
MNISRLSNHYRHLHQFPEPGFKEFLTQNYLKSVLESQTALNVFPVAGTGLLIFKKGNPGKRTIAFRADMDGLPLHENTGLAYSSKHPGFMHSCGHDGHMAILLELILNTAELDLRNNYLFIFQPAEEGPGGASEIIADRRFQEMLPEIIFGLHVHPSLPAGGIGCKSGSFFAGVSEFHISIQGREAHASTGDPCNALLGGVEGICQTMEALAKLESQPENVSIKEKHLLHFGRINSGIKENIIAASAQIDGTLRAFSPDRKKWLKDTLYREFEDSTKKRNLKLNLSFNCDYPVLINAKPAVEILKKVCQTAGIHFQDLPDFFLGEDFAFYLEKIPGAFFLLGVNDTDCSGNLHTANFSYNPSALATGVNLFQKIVEFLESRDRA